MTGETSPRDRIISTAIGLFVRHGYDGISMREIAAACQLSKAGLYYHFVDKEDLFLAILNTNLAELAELTRQASNMAGSAREKIAFFTRAIFLRLPPDRRDLIRLANQEIGKVSVEQRAAFHQRYREQFLQPLADILRQGAASGELRPHPPELGVWGLLGLMYPFFSSETARAEQDGEQVVEFVLELFFEGMQLG